MKRQLRSDFHCAHCRNLVSAHPLLSGVQNRNHCPYCLWSRHVDLHSAGDRLCACKAPMQPIGLSLKKGRDKYATSSLSGEMLLIHRCVDCGEISINRIAADDDVERLLETYHHSLSLDGRLKSLLVETGIRLLEAEDRQIVHERLFGVSREN